MTDDLSPIIRCENCGREAERNPFCGLCAEESDRRVPDPDVPKSLFDFDLMQWEVEAERRRLF